MMHAQTTQEKTRLVGTLPKCHRMLSNSIAPLDMPLTPPETPV
jgi:hypothetical protein